MFDDDIIVWNLTGANETQRKKRTSFWMVVAACSGQIKTGVDNNIIQGLPNYYIRGPPHKISNALVAPKV